MSYTDVMLTFIALALCWIASEIRELRRRP